MTRQDTIAHITSQLAALDDEGVQTVADIVARLAASAEPIRPLTESELALIEQAKYDFKAGRTCSLEEARARSDAFIETLRLKYPDAP